LWRLVLAYGCLGFGYVITATFIVAMLREGTSGGPAGRGAETVVWLIVGLTAAPSVVVWSRLSARIGAIRAYQAAMLIEATGVGLSALSTGTAALALAAAALGSTFVGLTAIGLQEAARRAGGDGRAMMALMTASFGLGQVIGPGLAGWLRDATGSFGVPSVIAAVVLVAGGLVVWPLREKGERGTA
jgi:predicted MFS family arabinose efflux permease